MESSEVMSQVVYDDWLFPPEVIGYHGTSLDALKWILGNGLHMGRVFVEPTIVWEDEVRTNRPKSLNECFSSNAWYATVSTLLRQGYEERDALDIADERKIGVILGYGPEEVFETCLRQTEGTSSFIEDVPVKFLRVVMPLDGDSRAYLENTYKLRSTNSE